MMAPWPDRVDSYHAHPTPIQQRPSQSQKIQNNQHRVPRRPHAGSTSSSSQFAGAIRMNEPPVLDNYQTQAESSSSDEDLLHPRSQPQRPRHSRSMSHPFPSLFSSKKKKSGPMAGDVSEEEGDDARRAGSKYQRPATRGHKNGNSTGTRDYATGNCMTCGSLVRWPRDLSVFKCTICLTVNDLQPLNRDPRRDPSRTLMSSSPDDRSWPNDGPVSLEHTKLLVTQCLRSYLESALRGGSRSQSFDEQISSVNFATLSVFDSNSSIPLPCSSLDSLKDDADEDYESFPHLEGLAGSAGRQKVIRQTSTLPRSFAKSSSSRRPTLYDMNPRDPEPPQQPPSPGLEARRMFKPLEDYVISCFTNFHCLNSSFAPRRPVVHQRRPTGESRGQRRQPEPRREREPQATEHPIIEMDAKLLLLGDFAENGSWWTGGQEGAVPGRSPSNRSDGGLSNVSARNPRIEWEELEEWYTIVVDVARPWLRIYDELVEEDPTLAVPPIALQEIEAQILTGQEHAQKALLKATETILKRPGRLITSPYELRFLLIAAANPLLHAGFKPYTGDFDHPDKDYQSSALGNANSKGSGPASGHHSGIIKRIVGLMSNAKNECHNHLIAWFARYPESAFVELKNMVAGFLIYRLIRQNEKKYEHKVDVTDGLIPSMNAGRSPASLHAALGPSSGSGSNNNNNNKKQKEKPKKTVYHDDWQIKASAQVLGLLFAANNMGLIRRGGVGGQETSRRSVDKDSTYSSYINSNSNGTTERVQARGQVLATSDFYTTLLDDSDLLADFESWEKKLGKFAFCQYPFLLSIGAKIRILEYDARRQMESKARDAFFNSLLTHRTIQQHLVLNVRRDCLVDDSLKAVSEVIGGGGEDIKKGLKINFKGEEGVDAGGLRKEWFLLLVREVFNPDYGMFIYDEDSQYCYFNPASLEPTEQFFLVGVVFGLAIYNSIILDVALPPFAFRKLLMAAPPPAAATSQPRQSMTYSLEDLAEYRPRLANGLRQLLDFEGDVESTFCLDFVVDVEKYGLLEKVSLCPNGERRLVTNANRREFVDLYVRYLLDTAVSRQFEPFKRGFFTVCGGNALSLFRPEEIELLVRGSDEPLDIRSLKVAAEYDNWKTKQPAEQEPVIRWFWETFESASPEDQRKLLLFITGSDRIPAMGAASLAIRISCLGDDCERFPSARTCFNMLALYRYASRRKLEELLWTAVYESEGFGLK